MHGHCQHKRCQQQAPPRISAADFAKQSAILGPKLSPDGKRFVARAQRDGKEALFVKDLVGEGRWLLTVPKPNDLNWYRWAGPNRILISVGRTVPYFDDEARMTTLLVYDLRT
jgi:hypothetical protein